MKAAVRKVMIILVMTLMMGFACTSEASAAARYYGGYSILSKRDGTGAVNRFTCTGSYYSQTRIRILNTGLKSPYSRYYPRSSNWIRNNTRYTVYVYNRYGNLWKVYRNLSNGSSFYLPRGRYKYSFTISSYLKTKSGYYYQDGRIGPWDCWNQAVYYLYC